MSFGIKKIGAWGGARRALAGHKKVKVAIKVASRAEAQFFRRKLVENITDGGRTGNKPFRRLQRGTRLTRRFRRRGGEKPLLVTADMRNSISVKDRGLAIFVGVPRNARGKDGRFLASVAQVQEFGRTIVIKKTRAMVRLLNIIYKQGESRRRRGRKKGGKRFIDRAAGREVIGKIVIRIRPRPFMRPVFNRFYGNSEEVRKRVMSRVAINLGGQFGLFGGSPPR